MAAGDAFQDVETIFQFSDDRAREAAFDHHWEKVEASASSSLDYEALRICVRLLPPTMATESAINSYSKLQRLLLDRISKQLDDEKHYLMLAGICLSNPRIALLVFDDIVIYISAIIGPGIDQGSQEISYDGMSLSKEEHIQRLEPYYRFLKCSYWLPVDQHHYISPALLSHLVQSIGQDGLDEPAHDVLSALLSLLTQPAVTVLETDFLPDSWIELHPSSNKHVLAPGVLSDSIFHRLSDLPLEYFSGDASKAFRTWFQWVSYMTTHSVETDIVYLPEYWLALRTGLLTGFSDQRKYCLGILQQSLVLCDKSFVASGMAFNIGKKEAMIKQYHRYCTLFETIVLDRYPNQVEACLPELTLLFGSASLISTTWVTTLLSAALNHKVQDGIRKLVGNWYLTYATSQPESCTGHTSFLVEGFLPWVTQGNLFTSSLVSHRNTTTCSHGDALKEAITQIVMVAPRPATIKPGNYAGAKDDEHSPSTSGQLRLVEMQTVVGRVLSYILNSGGKIFAPSVLYLLEGLIQGVRTSGIVLDTSELDLIIRVSRLPGFPEITADLCRTYCAELCELRDPSIPEDEFLPAQTFLTNTYETLQHVNGLASDVLQTDTTSKNIFDDLDTLGSFLQELERSQHKIIQNNSFSSACTHVSAILNKSDPGSLLPNELIEVLEAFWEEAERQDFSRPVAIRLPPLFFHPVCVHVSVKRDAESSENEYGLIATLTKALTSLHHFSEGRTYLISILATSLRKAALLCPGILNVLPLDDFLVRFSNQPPFPKKEFLFEVAAAQKLQEHLPYLDYGESVPKRDYETYYGQREWKGYAAVIDLLNRIPDGQLDVAKRVLDRLLEHWRNQKAPIPIISKWKNVLQLQIMLLLTESCIIDENADWYLKSFMQALILEPWPRYRYLLEWIISRIYFRFPSKTDRMLEDLAKLDDSSPVHIASLMKLALLAAPFLNSEEFALKLVVQLIPFSGSPKVHIRHEAHWSFPILFDLARQRNWASITENPAFIAMDNFIRGLDKFNAPPSTIRTLKLDAVKGFTITNIFQGRYLRIETPDTEYVAHEDFASLYESMNTYLSQYETAPPRVPLGDPLPASAFIVTVPEWKEQSSKPLPMPSADSNPTFFQTKSSFDVASLLPSAGPPSAQKRQPASVILIASLIDNPTNLGGLSRISESFGLEALYIDDLKKTAHKDFKSTSVNSEKHIPIRELKAPAVPEYLIQLKRQGYEVVGIEQTDKSGMLGEEEGGKGIGTLPRKCVLVLGSEKSGITREVLAVVDRCVEIKTLGVTRSLNVQTAGGIAVFEWWREWGGKV